MPVIIGMLLRIRRLQNSFIFNEFRTRGQVARKYAILSEVNCNIEEDFCMISHKKEHYEPNLEHYIPKEYIHTMSNIISLVRRHEILA